MVGLQEHERRKTFASDKTSHRNLKTHSQTDLVPCQALFFGVGTNDSRLVGRLLSVSQPECYELTQHEDLAMAWDTGIV